MKSILFSFIMLFLFQACQVNEKVASSKELSINSYPISDFQVVVSEDGWKKLGSVITIKLIHPHALTVSGNPYIEVKIGDDIKTFNYQTGSGSDTLTFSYTVVSGDLDEDGIQIYGDLDLDGNVVTNKILLNGGSITYMDATGVTTNTVTTFTPPAYNIRVDGVVPTLLSVKAPNSGNYTTNSHLIYTLRFDESVVVLGSPKIDIALSSGTVSASYSGGTGSRVLTFDYKILSSDTDNDGFFTSSSITLNPASSITITDQAGNSISTSIPSLSSQSLFFDYRSPSPKIISVTPSTLTGLAIAQPVDFTIEFPEPLEVISSAQISLSLPSGIITANYLSGTGTTNIKFRYLVQTGLENFSTINLLSPVEIKSSNNLYVNSAVPTIMSVNAPLASTYTLGQNMDFTMVFSSPVNVTGQPAIPLTLTTGPIKAKYLLGTGTNTLTFRYTVEAEKQDLDGITVGSQLQLLGGSIKDTSNTFNALLAMPSVLTTGVFVDSVAGPSVLFAYAPPAAIYTEGQNLDFTLVFNRPVTFTGPGTPQLPINLGGVTPSVIYADFQAGLSSGNTAVFRYTVQVGHNDTDGLTISDPINLNGGIIIDALGLAANLYYSAPNMSGIFVDGLAPYILSVTAPQSGTYGPGQILTFTATYNEIVTISSGSPQIPISLTTGPVYAQYSTGSGTNTLNFTYQVQTGDTDADGITVVSPIDMTGVSMVDGVGHPAVVPSNFTPPTTTGVLIDGSAPSITAMSVSPTSGNLILGQSLTFTTTWSEPVTFSGTPKILLNVGTTIGYANFQSCSSATVCTFKYSVNNGHSATGLTYNSLFIDDSIGSIIDASGNSANKNFAAVAPSLALINVDGLVPTITSFLITSSSNHTYIIGEDIEFKVMWSEPTYLPAGGSPNVSFVMGSQTVNASYISGAGTNAWLFRYTIQAGDYDNNGIDLYSTINLNGSIIRDNYNNIAYLSFTPPLTNLMLVDGVLPTITLITPPANGTYHLGDEVHFTIHWSEPINVDLSGGTPRIHILLSGSLTTFPPVPPLFRDADYNPALSSGSSMVFTYVVQAGDVDNDGIQILPTQIDLNGGSVEDLPGNLAVSPITFTPPVLSGVLIDAIRPYVTSISPPANGTYGIGDDVDITIHFSEPITVTGPLGLPSTVNTPYVNIYFNFGFYPAYYVSGSGTNNLVFRYTVQLNDSAPSGIYVVNPVMPNGGTLQDAAGNDSYLTFPTANYGNVKIDGVSPTVTSATSQNDTNTSVNGSFKPGEVMTFILTFSEPVTFTGSPKIELNIGGEIRYADQASLVPAPFGLSPYKIAFKYTVDANDVLLDLNGIDVNPTVDQSLGTITDLADNPFTTTFSFTEKDYVHYSGIMGRYQISPGNYSSVACGTNSCLTQVKDLSGLGNHLIKGTTYGPVVKVSGYGMNSTGYMQFNNSSNLKTTLNGMSIKQALIVMKSVTTSSTGNAHDILQNQASISFPWYSYQAGFSMRTPNPYNKSLNTDSAARFLINGGNFSASYVSALATSALWATNTNYLLGVEYQTYLPFNIASRIGSTGTSNNGFNGQIAEVILISPNSNLTELQILNIRDQLNDIHGAY